MKFLCYTNFRGDNEIEHWFERLSIKHQNKVLVVIELLRANKQAQWGNIRNVQKIRIGKGYYEITFSLDVEYRIVGYFIDGQDIFVMLILFQKHTRRNENRKAFDEAEKRRKIIEGYEGEFTNEYDFETNDISDKTIH